LHTTTEDNTYQFTGEGSTSPIGRTKTLPQGPTSSLRMAVVSCSNFAYGYFNVYARIAQRADLDLVMHLGDYTYEYGAGQYGAARTTEPVNEIVTLSDYRQRHAQYKRDVDSQAMHRQHPLVAIWDDHETANNSYKTGAENHQPATEGSWDARVAAAMQAYYEWMPVRPVDTANPPGPVHLDGVTAVAAVPEPGEWALMLVGLAGVAGMVRRRKA
jgi:alkaline phosphatase D